MKWYIKQLLPLRYETEGYSEVACRYFHVSWRMWLGRVFAQRWTWYPA